MSRHSPPRDLSSPERSKRPISNSPKPPSSTTLNKRPRGTPNPDSTKDSSDQHAPHLPPPFSHLQPSSVKSRAVSPSSDGSASGSEGTARIEDGNQHHHQPPSSRRTPEVPPPTSGSTTANPTRRSSFSQQPSTSTGQGSRWTSGPTQSSSTSSSSSSHRVRRSRLSSPPTSHTLSTGQPIVNPPLKTQAAFVGKLFAMLEDEEIRKTGLIHWSSAGHTFTCPNPTEFAKVVLPRFFKHNNWQSFVRQLNMYSFNKVNDLYATSSDPMAWEFRHPLFRQGESHLLASIKRKTTRPSHAEGGASALSPSDELSDPSRPVAGWMTEDTSTSPLSIPPRPLPSLAPPAAARPEVFGYNMKTGETIASRPYEISSRSSSKTFPMDSSTGRLAPIKPTGGVGIAQPQAPNPGSRTKRHRSETDGPPISTPRGTSSQGVNPRPSLPPALGSSAQIRPSTGYSEYPQPSLPSPSPIMALTGQVAFLEERIARLSETLSVERVENVRTHMDTLSYVASIALWLPNAPAKDITALQESLNRQTAELRHRYDALVAVDALAHLAGRSEGLERDQNPPQSNYPQVPPYHTQTYPPTTRPFTSPPRTLPSIGNLPKGSRSSISGPIYSHSILPQHPSIPGHVLHPPPPQPPTSDRPVFDQPPFSRSPLLRRPESMSSVGAGISSEIANGGRPGMAGGRTYSGAGSSVGERDEKRDSGAGGSMGTGKNLRDLLN